MKLDGIWWNLAKLHGIGWFSIAFAIERSPQIPRIGREEASAFWSFGFSKQNGEDDKACRHRRSRWPISIAFAIEIGPIWMKLDGIWMELDEIGWNLVEFGEIAWVWLVFYCVCYANWPNLDETG